MSYVVNQGIIGFCIALSGLFFQTLILLEPFFEYTEHIVIISSAIMGGGLCIFGLYVCGYRIVEKKRVTYE